MGNTTRFAAALLGSGLSLLAAGEGAAHAFISPPPTGSRRSCEHLVCITVKPPAPPPPTFGWNIQLLLQEDDNWQREKAEGPGTRECVLGNQGPELRPDLLQADEMTRFEAECFKNAMRGAYDGSVGLVGSACTGVYDRVRNPQRLAQDAALVWSTFDQLALVAAETILEPDVQAARAVNYCARQVASLQQMTQAERRRAAAQVCRALGELAGGAALTGGIAGAMRAGASSGIFSVFRQSVRAKSIAPVTPVLRATAKFERQGSKSVMFHATMDGQEVLVKVPKLEAGVGIDDLLAEVEQGFPAPQHGGMASCNRGVVDLEYGGFTFKGVAMSPIPGIPLDRSDVLVRRMLRQSHIDSFTQSIARLRADGKAFHDLHAGNLIVSPDGRIYIYDNKTIARPTNPSEAFRHDREEQAILDYLQRLLGRRP